MANGYMLKEVIKIKGRVAMSKVGFIKDWRQELESDIWLMPPMYHRVWQWIKYSVNHSTGKIPNKDGTFTLIEPGQHATSYRLIAQGVGHYEGRKWKEPNVKTRKSILDWLVKQNMISVQSNSKGTIITVVNWGLYQSEVDKGNSERIAEETLEKHLVDTKKNEKNDKNKDYVSVFNFYLTLDLVKHRSYTNDMAKAIKKAVKDNKYEIEYCKELLKRHETVVEKTKNSQYPVKVRGFAEFFGQKVFGGTHLICSEYEEGGKYYEQYIKNSNQGNRLGVPPSESKLGKREEPWM